MPRFHLHHQTRQEFRQRVSSGEIRACLLPIGAIEQHLEHLEMEHDWRSVTEVSDAVASKLDPHVIVASGVMAGISEHHMDHPGTLSLRPATFLAVLGDLIDSLKRSGLNRILVLNGHGGNEKPCRAVWDQYLRQFRINLQFLSYWDVLDSTDANLLTTRSIPGHAQEFETAIALARFPGNLRETEMSQQQDVSPTHATAETGQILFSRIVDRVSEKIQQMIDGTSVAEIPPMFP